MVFTSWEVTPSPPLMAARVSVSDCTTIIATSLIDVTNIGDLGHEKKRVKKRGKKTDGVILWSRSEDQSI